jgi:putative DNA primase/helicase
MSEDDGGVLAPNQLVGNDQPIEGQSFETKAMEYAVKAGAAAVKSSAHVSKKRLARRGAMSGDTPTQIAESPKADIVPEERARCLKSEVDRLASLPVVEWRYYVECTDVAEKRGVSRTVMRAMVEATNKERENKAKQEKAEQEKVEQRVKRIAAAKKKQKERAFRTLDALPEAEQEKRLDELARGLDEDPATVREEFATSFPPPVESKPELWPETVDTVKLLADLVKQIRRYVVIRDDGTTAVALFAAMSWIHNAVATHSPILAATSSDPDSGKTTLLGVLGLLVPKPFRSAEPTGAAAFRLIDREHPTMIVDEADDIFQRKKDLVHIVNASWTRGTPIPRSLPRQAGVHWYDVFCPKIIGLKGMKVPKTTASRFITIKMLPRLPEETIEDFPFVDGPEFVEIRRKLARWATDNAVALGGAKPEQPPGFHNRLAANWRLLFAIADHAGGDWRKRARQAAVKLSHEHAGLSQGRRLLAALQEIYTNRAEIPSAEIVQLLAADPDAEWCEYRGRTPISQRQLALLLKKYEIYPSFSIQPSAQICPGTAIAARNSKTHGLDSCLQFRTSEH